MANTTKRRMHVVDEDGDGRQERGRKKKKKKKSRPSSKKDRIVPLLFAALGGGMVSYIATKHFSKRDEERREADTKARERDLERISALLKPMQQALPAPEQPTPALLFSFMEDD